jgi:hypothetical protein
MSVDSVLQCVAEDRIIMTLSATSERDRAVVKAFDPID